VVDLPKDLPESPPSNLKLVKSFESFAGTSQGETDGGFLHIAAADSERIGKRGVECNSHDTVIRLSWCTPDPKKVRAKPQEAEDNK
jgi:hypothetical protein